MEVIKDYLRERILGLAVESARVLRPSVVRPQAGDLASDLPGRTIEEIERRGKFLVVFLSGDRQLVVNPMLTGAIQLCESGERMFKRTCVVLGLSDGRELRYLDDKQMGKLYYVSAEQVDGIPRLGEQGPDVLAGISFEEFQQWLKPFRGEIKGILTRGQVISGIGNAYADEILFEAEVYPFKKKGSLSEEELRRLLESSRKVASEAIDVLRTRVDDRIHVKVRDFLKVHNKGGEPCPRCGATISQVTANRRITSYCRRCQPGMLIRN